MPKSLSLAAAALLVLCVGCKELTGSAPAAAAPLPPEQIVAAGTAMAPTRTPEPTPTPDRSGALAARVNGQEITKQEFELELRRLIAGQPDAPGFDSPEGQQLAAQFKDQVLDQLIVQAVIDQEAARLGIAVTDQQVDDEIAIARQKIGGPQKYADWLAANQQSEADARFKVQQQLTEGQLTARIEAQVPPTAEYIRLFQIVLPTELEANQVLAQLKNGAKFIALAQARSIDEATRTDDGDLGWVARHTGSIIWPEVEAAAFALASGETSPVVASPIGFHILRVTGREVRPLAASDSAFLRQMALHNWIEQLRLRAKIEKFI